MLYIGDAKDKAVKKEELHNLTYVCLSLPTYFSSLT